MPVTEIAGAADLAAALKANKSKLVVVDFYATWCGPCKAIAPHVDNLSTRYAKEAAFFKVDVDKAPDIAKDAGVTAMPSFGFYGDGKMVELMKGADPKGLEERVKKYSAQFFKSPFTGSGYSLSGSRPASAAATAPVAAAQSTSGAAAPAGGSARRNPWADPNFMPGAKKGASAAAGAAAAPAASTSTANSTIPAGSKLLNPASSSSASSSSSAASSSSAPSSTASSSSSSPAPSSSDASTTAAAPTAAPAAAAAASSHPALQVKPELLQQLRDMGFQDVRAQKALLFTGNKDAEDALTWLMEHQDDADIDEPLEVVGVEKKDNGGLPAGVNIDDLDEDAQVLYADLQKRRAKEQAATAASSRSAAASSAASAPASASTGKKPVSEMTSEEKQQWLEDRRAAVKAKKESEALEKVKSDFKSTKGMTSALNELKDQREEFERQQAIARRKKEDADKSKQRREVQQKIAADKERRRLEQERTMAALQKAKDEKANAGK